MSYKNIIETIKTICDNHYFINQFGYGEISDISTPDDKDAPDYPYMFLNPVNVSKGNKTSSFNFNLICMTQAYDTETDTIHEQSNCIRYVQDIIASVNNTLDNPLIEFIEPYSITPFKERFSDDVVGATANLTIEYADVLDNCFPPISGTTPSTDLGIPVKVVDGDETIHYVNPGGTYECLPATAKEGIFYQRVIPWDNYRDDDPENSVGWLRKNTTTYNYTPPTNPLYISTLANGYEGNDDRCLLAQKNSFGNFFRYTDKNGNQYVEHLGNSNPQGNYCIDHLTGLGIYVEVPYNYENYTWAEAIDAAVAFTGEGYDDWRLADVNEYLTILNYNDLTNAWTTAYTPWLNERLRQYGARLWLGCRNNDGHFNFFQTNGATIGSTSSTALTMPHSLKVRNHFW
jgi:hypothetical protein